MSHTPVAPNLHQASNAQLKLAAKISFNAMFALKDFSNSPRLAFGKFANPGIRIDSGLGHNLLGARETNSVDIGERVLNSLIAWKIHTCYTCQTAPPLALSLLVLGIDANYTHYALPFDYLALLANLFHGSSYFHFVSIL
jgi:hypothetical protein